MFHVCFLMGTPVHMHLAKRLLKVKHMELVSKVNHFGMFKNDSFCSVKVVAKIDVIKKRKTIISLCLFMSSGYPCRHGSN